MAESAALVLIHGGLARPEVDDQAGVTSRTPVREVVE
jgi:hypothetical protein